MADLTHIAPDGSANMVDVSAKPTSRREAVATAFIQLQSATLDKIQDNQIAKGNVLTVAKIAGIQAAKQTQHLIPLCHQIALSKVDVTFDLETNGIRLTGTALTTAQTGVEMEALSAVSIAALTIYDMCKAIDKDMVIAEVKLIKKTKEQPSTSDD